MDLFVSLSISIHVDTDELTGAVGPLAVLTGLTSLGLGFTKVSGDVGPLAALTGLTFLYLEDTNVTGCPLLLSNGKTCDCGRTGSCR
jgi:hypothetical protein